MHDPHSPEPWKFTATGGALDANGRRVSGMSHCINADRVRVVACVNACVGIPTDVLRAMEPWVLANVLMQAVEKGRARAEAAKTVVDPA